MTSIGAWIDAQAWTAARKVAAHAIASRRTALNLNPMTAGEWAAWSARLDAS